MGWNSPQHAESAFLWFDLMNDFSCKMHGAVALESQRPNCPGSTGTFKKKSVPQAWQKSCSGKKLNPKSKEILVGSYGFHRLTFVDCENPCHTGWYNPTCKPKKSKEPVFFAMLNHAQLNLEVDVQKFDILIDHWRGAWMCMLCSPMLDWTPSKASELVKEAKAKICSQFFVGEDAP